MRKNIFSLLTTTVLFFLSPILHAQIGKNFGDEINTILKTEAASMKGEKRENKQSALTKYSIKLPLTGFDITYSEIFGNDALNAKLIYPGSDATMDTIYTKLTGIGLSVSDSKTDPALPVGTYEQRTMLIKPAGNALWKRINISLNKYGSLVIMFFKT